MNGSMRVLAQEPSSHLPFLSVLAHTHAASMPGCGVAAGALPHLEANAAGGAAGWPRGPGSPASIPVGEEVIPHLSQASSDSGLCLLWLRMPLSSGWTIRLCETTAFGRSRMVTSAAVRSLAVGLWCESNKSFQICLFCLKHLQNFSHEDFKL